VEPAVTTVVSHSGYAEHHLYSLDCREQVFSEAHIPPLTRRVCAAGEGLRLTAEECPLPPIVGEASLPQSAKLMMYDAMHG
jgi:hypothetical protein